MSDPRLEPAAPLSDAEIGEIEKALGRELPEDYRRFLRTYGGAFVGGLINGSNELPILTFFGAGECNGLLPTLRRHPDLRSEGTLPIADCELGNLYVLDREHAVHYINYYGGKTTARKVSHSFQDFVSRIVVTGE